MLDTDAGQAVDLAALRESLHKAGNSLAPVFSGLEYFVRLAERADPNAFDPADDPRRHMEAFRAEWARALAILAGKAAAPAEEPDGFTVCRCGRVAEGADAAEFPTLGDILDDGVDFYPDDLPNQTPGPTFPPTHAARDAKAEAVRKGVMP